MTVLLFSTTNKENLKNLSLVIKTFEHSFGLKVNLYKSLIAGVNVETVLLPKAKEIWGCQSTDLSIDYLGMPLGGNMKSHTFWAPILERMEKKFDSWKFSYI